MRGPRQLLDVVRDALATPSDVIRTSRSMRVLSEVLSGAPMDRARSFLPGLIWPADMILVPGEFDALAPNGNRQVTFQLQQPGVVVGLMIHGTGLTLPLDTEAANLGYQLTREATVRLAANINKAGAGIGQDGYASVRGMTSQWPWLPTMLPARGAGTWSLDIKNFHPTDSIRPVANLAFLSGMEAYRLSCAHLSKVPDDDSDDE